MPDFHVQKYSMTNRKLEKCLHIVNMEKKLSCREISLHKNAETNLFCHNLCFFRATYVLLPISLFCHEICIVTINAHLRGENIEPKIVSVKKKGQISGMGCYSAEDLMMSSQCCNLTEASHLHTNILQLFSSKYLNILVCSVLSK